MKAAAAGPALLASGVEAAEREWLRYSPPVFWNKVLNRSTEALMVEDFLLPVQMESPRRDCEHDGERRLLLAIVHQAWCDLHGEDRVARDEAWRWFTRSSEAYLCNFHTICDLFGWDFGWVIKHLMRTRDITPLFLVRRYR